MSETDIGLSELPDGWVWTPLERISEIILGQSPPSSTYNTDGKGLPFYQGKLEFGETYPTPRKWCTTPKKIAEKGDVFISVRAPVGPTNLCPEKSCVGRGLAAIRGLSGIEPFFILYLMRAYEDVLAGKGAGTTFNAITGNQLKTFEIALPPLPEQHRIVIKIEELFTKLDAGINELHKAQSQLKRYRQSVLKAAFEGKLTEAWRAEYQEKIEPASVLLERILKERREQWETEQLNQMKAKGNMPKDDKWKAKYKEPVAPDTSNLPKLPNGWKWVKLGQVTYLITKGSSPRWQGFNYVDRGIFFLRSQNVGWGGLDLSNIAHLPEAFNEKERKSILKEGDVLLNLVGASIGRAAIASDELEGANMNQAVALIRLVKDGLDNKFLTNYLLSPEAQSTIHGKKVDVARANLSLTDVSEFAVPLPPFLEQQAIGTEVESRLSIADEVEKTITVELKRAEQLRQSILKKAFSGKLVPQDPNDQPASVLLERIKAQKEIVF